MKLASKLGLVWLYVATGQSFAQSPLDVPRPQVLTEARALVQSMIDNPRGPYSRIRWFCNDGTIQPPVASACREHGGGRQHGEYSESRSRLAALGWSVGTIYAALRLEDITDDATRRQRLRELALEKYLTDIDDGWVLRQARNYRGRAQIEDEEATGNSLLLGLFNDTEWVEKNFLLARESVRVFPHLGTSDDIAREVRRKAIEIAEADRTFEPLRAEIHGASQATTSARVRNWAAAKNAPVADSARQLAASLELMYGAEGRRARLARHYTILQNNPVVADWVEILRLDWNAPAQSRLTALSDVLANARLSISSNSTNAQLRLRLFDLINDTEGEVLLTAAEVLANEQLTRGALLELASHLIDACFGSGFLNQREVDSIKTLLSTPDNRNQLRLSEYGEIVTYLRRLPQWASGTVRHAFAEPLVKYTALDARASRFVDDMMRGSPLASVAEITRRLARDYADLTGVRQIINDETALSAFGLNPGIAQGELKIFANEEELSEAVYDRLDIVVLPETTAELSPVAGIITMGEGNPLSHVQLLARNFGIPNIAINPNAIDSVRTLQNKAVLTGVASDGSLVIADLSRVPTELRELMIPANLRGAQLTVPTPDLSSANGLALAELNSGLSGRTVGPKAANLGELARLFPGRVAPAVAVPFGIFAAHINAPTGADGASIKSRLVGAYSEHSNGLIDDDELNILLADIRQQIASIEILPEYRQAIARVMSDEFGTNDGYGVFVRSDTNVEDLPQFTGAGLSETLPNVTGVDAILNSIPRVWASVLSPRAIAWRSSLLTNPEEVYASVLLMQSVPSTKSGVMVTTNLSGTKSGLTVSAAWGVGGGVGGEATETIVLHDDDTETLISEAKSPYQRHINSSGGLQWVAAPDGRVLSDAEHEELRELARIVDRRYERVYDSDGKPRPWDIEYGFIDGELTLFQIRPLVERGQQLADRIVAELVPRSTTRPPRNIPLNTIPGSRE